MERRFYGFFGGVFNSAHERYVRIVVNVNAKRNVFGQVCIQKLNRSVDNAAQRRYPRMRVQWGRPLFFSSIAGTRLQTIPKAAEKEPLVFAATGKVVQQSFFRQFGIVAIVVFIWTDSPEI